MHLCFYFSIFIHEYQKTKTCQSVKTGHNTKVGCIHTVWSHADEVNTYSGIYIGATNCFNTLYFLSTKLNIWIHLVFFDTKNLKNIVWNTRRPSQEPLDHLAIPWKKWYTCHWEFPDIFWLQRKVLGFPKLCNYNFVGNPPKCDCFGTRNGKFPGLGNHKCCKQIICLSGNSQMLKEKLMLIFFRDRSNMQLMTVLAQRLEIPRLGINKCCK